MRTSFFPSFRLAERPRRRYPLAAPFALEAAGTVIAGQNVRGEDPVNAIVQVTGPIQPHPDKVVARVGAHKSGLSGAQGASFFLPASLLQHRADDPEIAFTSVDNQMPADIPATANALLTWSLGYTGNDPSSLQVIVSDNGQNVRTLSTLWRSSTVWGSAVCGTHAVWGSNAMWRGNAVWGSSGPGSSSTCGAQQ